MFSVPTPVTIQPMGSNMYPSVEPMYAPPNQPMYAPPNQPMYPSIQPMYAPPPDYSVK